LTLSGISLFSAKTNGGAAFGEFWSSAAGNSRRVFVRDGIGWANVEGGLAMPLVAGDYTVAFAIEPPTNNLSYGLALHFNGLLNPNLAVVNRREAPEHDFRTIIGARVLRLDGAEAWSPDYPISVLGGHNISITGFSLRASDRDAVGLNLLGPSGRNDGRGTLQIHVAPEPTTLLAWGFALPGLRWARRRRVTASR